MQFVFLIFLALLLFTTGCKKNDEPPTLSYKVPEQYDEQTDLETPKEANLSNWWTSLQDPVLNECIEQAIGKNFNFLIAQEKILEVRANYRIQASKLFPEVQGNGFAFRVKRSHNFDIFSIPQQENSIVPLYENLFGTGFDVLWELDFFGRVRNSKQAALYEYFSTIEQARNVQITLVAEVAREYANVRSYYEMLNITMRFVEAQKGILELTRSQFESGLVSDLDVLSAESQLKEAESGLPIIQSELSQSLYQLGVLMGQTPESLEKNVLKKGPIPVATNLVPIGLPSELLRRRPDIRKAEQDLFSAKALIKVARADLFPRFSLTGAFEFQSNHAHNLFNSASRAFGVGPVFIWDILNGGRILANIDAATSRQKQAALQYEQTVLDSLKEVETSLSKYANDNERTVYLEDAVRANRKEVELTRSLYQAGLVDLSQVLSSEKNLYLAEELLIQSKQALILDLANLYKALGGGW